MPALENRSSALLEGDAMGNFAKSEKNHDVSEMTAHSSTYTTELCTEERTARGTQLMDELNNDGIVEEQNPSVNYVHHDSGHGFDFTKTEIKALKKFVLHILSRSHGNGIIDSEDSEEKRRLISNDVDEEQSTVNMMDDISSHRAQMTSKLSEDTFSFLITSPVRSIPFVTGMFVVLMKGIIYSLILANMLSNRKPGNPLGIPASTSWPIVVTQVFAVGITVITQDDLVTALRLIHEGYDMERLGKAFEHSRYWKWAMSVAFLFSVGIYGLWVTFMLIITSDTVVNLILNFTAIEFISLLDNVVFQLAVSSFFGVTNRNAAASVIATEYELPIKKGGDNPWFQIITLLASFLAMLGILLFVLVNQINGSFLPQHIIIQFNDDVQPSLPTYSSKFEIQVNKNSYNNGRIVYKSEIGDTTIGFCDTLKAWTLGPKERTNFCEGGAMAISSGPANLDISAILGKEWFVRIGADSNRLLPLTNVYSNRGCVTNLDCGGEGRGECLRGSCSCEAGFFGLRCHYDESKVCDHIRVNELTDEFTGLRRRVSVEFVVLRNDDNGKVVTAYEHPVYVEPDASQKDAGQVVDVIVYCGLRWLLTSIAVPDDGRLDLHFTDFHASSNTLQAIEAATEPVRFNTAVDERSAPVDLQWFIAGSSTISDMKPILTINTVLLCTKCDESNPCAFGNTCTKTTKTCNCKHGEKGSLCQVVPLGDGRCDPFFNKIEFDMDDGDCCEATCRSSDQFKCGVLTAESGIDSLQLGFPFCQDPKLGCASESNCWTPKSSHIPLLIGRSDGVSVHISANGRTIVISEPELDTVRVFDQEDRDWIQRGQTLEGHARSRFGTYVAISALPGTVVKRRSGRMPIFIAVASAGRAYNAVDVFSFEPYATLWEKVGQSLSFNQTIDSLTIGSSGSDIKVAVGLRENSTAMVYRVLTDAQAFDWQLYWKTFGSIVGLSGDGNYFFLTSVKPFTGSGAFDIRSVTSPDEELTNMMPFGVEKFYIESRPAYTLASYDGRVASLYGLPFAGPTGYDTVSVYGARRADTDDVYDGVTLLSFVDIDSYTLNQTSFAMSPDTMVSGINYGGYIELFNTEEGHAMFERNSSQIPKFKVNSHHNTFAISDGGHVMAVVLEDHVKVVQQNIACNATSVRLAITLDEVPESVSWSVDYVGFVGDKMFATENIRSCDHCYSGDPRYTRVVVVEDFCVPEELAPCIQVSFKIDRKLGDGAGFVGLKDGVTFVEYSGNHETVALVPGKCEWSCLNDNMAFAMVMSFDGDYPSRLETHQDEIILWSTKSKPLPRSGGPVLVKRCLESNQIDLLRVVRPDRGRGNGALEIYLDGKLEAKQVFDIGPVQIIDIASMVEREEVLKTVSAKCVNNNCPVCSVCSEGMIVAPSEKVDIGSFEGIFCPELNEIGLRGMISEEFCEIYPANIGTLCGCKVQGCQDDQVEMAVKVDFDRAPSEISFTVRNDNGVILWAHDFLAFKGNENLLAGQEETFKSCVPRYGALNFRISDSRGDGLCCIEGDIDVDAPLFTPSPDERGYEIYLGEELVSKRDFVFGDYQDLRLRAGEKSSPVNVDQHLFCENCLPCSVCPGAGSYGYAVLDQVSFEIEGTFGCSHVNNWLGIIVDEAFCVKHQAHLASSCGCLSYEIVCEVGESKLSFELGAQQKYQSISLKVMNQYKDILFIKSGFNAITDDGLPYSMWKYEACIPSLERVYIEVYDSIWWNSSTYIENPLQFGLFVDGSSSWRDTFFGSTLEYVIGEEYTPSPTIPRTLPPTVTGAPVFQFEQREHPPCNICGEGKEITILEAILTLPGTTETASCVEAQQMANLGWVPPDQCSLVPFLVSEPCGCK